jgi:branched-chain amino acid aminotransferase
VTPDLGDTILPGVTRSSLLTLAQDMGLKTDERRISIEEAMSEAKECFVSGTAAGLSYIESITHNGTTVELNNRKMGEVARNLLVTLKGIQYGKVEDTHGWMFSAT